MNLDRNPTKSGDRNKQSWESRTNLDTEWLLSIFEGTPIPINVFDLEGNIIAANEALIEFAGVSSFDDLKGFNIFNDPNMSAEMKERLHSGENIRYQSEIDFQLVREFDLYPTERTDIAYVETGMTILESPLTGKKIGYLVQLLDISEQKRLETELKQSQKEFKELSREFERILDAIPGIVFYKDRNGNFIRVNEYLAKAHDMSKDELEGKSTFDLYPESQAEAYLKDDLEVIESGEPKTNVVEPWTTKDETKWINTSKIPLRDDDGKIVGVVGISIDITERKRMEDELKDRERQVRKVLESVPAGIVIVEAKTKRIVEANSKACEITGFDEDELEGALCNRYLCPTEKDECPILDLDQEVDNSERTCLTKDGSRIPILKTVKSITLGKNEYLLESFVDISQQKGIEKALRASEERYRTLIDVLPAGVAIADSDEKFEMVNQPMSELLGYDSEKLIGRSLLEFVDPAYHSKIFVETKKREKGVDSSYEIQVINADGEKRDIHLTATPHFNDSGEVAGSIGIFYDITERKESQRELRETTYQLQERIKEMEALYAMADLSNETDIPMSEALQSAAQIVKDAFQYPDITCVRVLFEGQEYTTSNFEETEWKLEQDIWCEGERIGNLQVYYLESRPASDRGPFLSEEVDLIASIAIQIGEYIELRRTQQRREEQHRELELYASLLRHDLKNDLGAILGNLDILKMILRDADEETRKTISSAEAVCERMNSLLTALSRPAETIETNLYRLIDRIAGQTTEEEPQLTINITADADAEGARIPASRLLPMVFENLFRNSLDFIEEDPVITVKLSNESGMVEALVSDNGPGVADEVRDNLFERGSSTRGGGMGLYLSKQILEGLDGSIELVDASLHEGATFRVMLPTR